MIQEELGFYDWMLKFSERLVVINACFKMQMDRISEDDWQLMESVYYAWTQGELPAFYKSVPPLESQTITEVDLFTNSTNNTL